LIHKSLYRKNQLLREEYRACSLLALLPKKLHFVVFHYVPKRLLAYLSGREKEVKSQKNISEKTRTIKSTHQKKDTTHRAKMKMEYFRAYSFLDT